MAEFELEIIKNGNLNLIFDEADEKSTLEIAVKAVAQAKALSPVAEENGGRSRNSIMYKNNKQKGGFNDSSGEKSEFEIETGNVPENEMMVGFNVLYGVYQEFGTRHMKPQPFLRPSLALMQGQKSVDIIKKVQAETLRGKLVKGQKREKFIL